MPDAKTLVIAIVAALVIVLPFVWFMYKLKRDSPETYESANKAGGILEAIFRFFGGG